MDSLTLAISQGSLRRGSAAVYLDVSHPEIEEFLEIRKPSGDFNRKALNLHHGVADHRRVHGRRPKRAASGTSRSPKDGSIRATSMRARCSRSWSKRGLRRASPTSSSTITVNKAMPKHHRELGLQGLDVEPLLRNYPPDRDRDHLGQ